MKLQVIPLTKKAIDIFKKTKAYLSALNFNSLSVPELFLLLLFTHNSLLFSFLSSEPALTLTEPRLIKLTPLSSDTAVVTCGDILRPLKKVYEPCVPITVPMVDTTACKKNSNKIKGQYTKNIRRKNHLKTFRNVQKTQRIEQQSRKAQKYV